MDIENSQASIYSSVLSSQQEFEVTDIKTMVHHSSWSLGQTVLWLPRQINVTAQCHSSILLENSKKIHPQGEGHALKAKRRE